MLFLESEKVIFRVRKSYINPQETVRKSYIKITSIYIKKSIKKSY